MSVLQGEALDKYAKKTVKVLVVGNPANTNALICSKYAPSIPRENFTAMTRLDQNRGRAQIAERLKVSVGQVKNVIIWGNHSATQVPDANSATVDLGSGPTLVPEALKNDEWLKGEFITVSRYWFVCSLSAWIFRNLVIPNMSYYHENP